MKIYLVGGAVRDKLMGIENPKDLDYVVVLDNIDGLSVEEGFKQMEKYLQQEGYYIFLSTPDMFTIRAKFPQGHKEEGLTADFVLARKEVGYVEGTRRPILELGSLYDDLERRDFTVNAMAEDENGAIIDYFWGQKDLEDKMLVTPKDAKSTMLDDPLRFLRALRFSITKEMNIDDKIFYAINYNTRILDKLNKVVSQERIREELNKIFKYNTLRSMRILTDWDDDLGGKLLPILFKDGYYLQMTNKKPK